MSGRFDGAHVDGLRRAARIRQPKLHPTLSARNRATLGPRLTADDLRRKLEAQAEMERRVFERLGFEFDFLPD